MCDAISVCMSRSRRERRNNALRKDFVFASTLNLLGRRVEEGGDGVGQLSPFRRFRTQLFAAGGGQRVIFRPAFLFTFSPFGLDPALMLQAVQGGIQRALRDL